MDPIDANGNWIGVPVERPLTEQQQWHTVLGIILHMSAVLLSILGVAVFTSTPDLRTGSTRWHNWIIFYVSFGDFCLNVLQAGTLIDMNVMQKWRHTEAWCQFQGYLSVTGGFTSILGLSLLTQERAHTILMKKTWTGLHTAVGFALCCTIAFANVGLYWWGGNMMAIQESGVYCAPDWGGVLRPQPYPKFNKALTILNGTIVTMSIFQLTGIHIAIWLTVLATTRRFTTRDPNAGTLHNLNNAPKSGKSTKKPHDTPVNAKNSVDFGASDHLPAVIFSKLEQDVARKCAKMVTSFLIHWAPHTAKMLLVSFTQRPTTAQFDLISSLLAVGPGISNPLINYAFDVKWRNGAKWLFTRIGSQCSKVFATISGALKSSD